jgi:hypothetical protein
MAFNPIGSVTSEVSVRGGKIPPTVPIIIGIYEAIVRAAKR